MRSIRRLLSIALAAILVMPAGAAVKIYYLRHAQTGGNVAKYWQGKPKSEWPWYAGNAEVFSPKGREQVSKVAALLAPYHFDFIAVSPMWRTRQTIMPYLRAHDLQAVIWPELHEFGHMDGDLALIGTSSLPPPSPELFTAGPAVFIPGHEHHWFKVAPDDSRLLQFGHPGAEGAADLTAAMQQVIAKVRQRIKGGDQSILLVGHGTAGKYLLWLLTGERWVVDRGLDNTGLWMAEQQPDGSFKLEMADDKMLATMPDLEAFKHPAHHEAAKH